ncbi:isocitrate lyase/phosphoenolpyruvate mutase family protein [Marinibaculum pumilum]|uniref:Isocitrate lyase/phosphoenolpyruvate mutase family protein n=1 Tax=Marinibaculum pumilum TaxID=1766165 RepID=A0ABV7L025_9PROT
MPDQREKAARFAALHREGCFVLPNAWDVASAAICLEAGYPAVGTSSIAIAFTQGRRDGELLGRDGMLELAGRIAAAMPCPVTADLEAGYGTAPEAVAESVRRAVAAGLVGANIEDSDPADHRLIDAGLAEARIAAAVAAAREAGLPDFVVNARTDPFFRGMPAEEAFPEAVRRANRYLASGAACVFVPGPADAETAAALAAAIDGPLNLMAGGRGPTAPVAALTEAGVRRISLGGSLMGAAYGGALAALRGIREEGSFAYEGPAREPFRSLVRFIYRKEDRNA